MSNSESSLFLLLAIAFTMANLPFVFERIFFVRKPAAGKRKALGWSLVELVVLYAALGVTAALLEVRANGSLYEQGWAFYVTTFCMFLVFAFPGFTYRHLWHPPRAGRASE